MIWNFFYISLLLWFGPLGSDQTGETPEFVLQTGHMREVNGVAFSPDGRFLISAGLDSVRIWEASTGRLLRILKVASTSAELSPDGSILATDAIGYGSINLWDIATGKLVRTLGSAPEPAAEMVFSPDGKLLVSALAHGTTVRVWEVATGKLIKTLASHQKRITAVAFSPDGLSLASAGRNANYTASVKIWAVQSGKLLKSMETPDTVYSLSYSIDGRMLALAGGDGVLSLWQVETGKVVATLRGHRGVLYSVAMSPRGLTLATAGVDKTVKIWDLARGELLQSLEGHSDTVFDVAFTLDGTKLASVGIDRSVRVWDAFLGKPLYVLAGSDEYRTSVAFSSDGKILLSAISNPGEEAIIRSRNRTAKIWDRASGKFLGNLGLHTSDVTTVAISPDTTIIASAGSEGYVKTWKMFSGELLHSFKTDYFCGKSLSFSPDGKLLAANCHKEVIIWTTETGAILRRLKGHTSDIEFVSFSPDGTKLASGSGGRQDPGLRIWEVATGNLLRSLPTDSLGFGSLAFSPDGKMIAAGLGSGGSGIVKVWEVDTGDLRRILKGHRGTDLPIVVTISPDGKTLASGGHDHAIKLWNMTSGELLRTLQGHAASVDSLAFSPDGAILASGSYDGSIRYWRAADGTALAASFSFGEKDYITYTTDGYYIASEAGERYASWRIGTEIYSFDQYSEIFRRSDQVAMRMAAEDVDLPEVHLASDRPPELTWLQPFTTTKDRNVKLSLSYEGQAELEDLVVILNNQPISVDIRERAVRATVEVPLELGSASNRLVAIAFDRRRLRSRPLLIEFEYLLGSKGPGSSVASVSLGHPVLGDYGRKFAVIIGISDYRSLPAKPQTLDGMSDLKYGHLDAIAIETFLKDSSLSGGGWEIVRLLNQEATTAAIDDAVSRVLLAAAPQDFVLIFFSGHSRQHRRRPGDIYLLPYDYDIHNPLSGFPYSLLLDLLEQAKADHSVTLIDSCWSGVVGFGSKGSGSPLPDRLAQRIRRIRDNHVLFTSTDGPQYSWEDDALQHGVFTYYLLQGLYGKAPEIRHPEFVDLGELRDYVTKEVEEHTSRSTKMSPQRPRLFEKDGAPDDSFPVAIRRQP